MMNERKPIAPLNRLADIATIILAGCAVVATVSIVSGSNDSATTTESDRFVENWHKYVQDGTRIGPADATVTLLEFGDYECPYCRRLQPLLDKVLAAYPDRVALVYRHFPLDYHANAYTAARFATCADNQGSFDVVHAMLYRDRTLPVLDPISLGERANLPHLEPFVDCATGTEQVPEIEADLAAGRAVGVQATPTVLVNGLLLAATPDSVRLFAMVDSILHTAGPTGGL